VSAKPLPNGSRPFRGSLCDGRPGLGWLRTASLASAARWARRSLCGFLANDGALARIRSTNARRYGCRSGVVFSRRCADDTAIRKLRDGRVGLRRPSSVSPTMCRDGG
jgi:hypothetical protein